MNVMNIAKAMNTVMKTTVYSIKRTDRRLYSLKRNNDTLIRGSSKSVLVYGLATIRCFRV